ncbi:MAG: hypothetical protein PF637_10475 [Spirochaetes bacterium]|jgi:mannose-6-phosphate isomerase-like protein (cupin superfamily)|nr:hypothetical protein [Spirochaetota bacterium]
MVITKVEDTPVMDTAHNVDARNVYNTEDAMVTIIRLKPGQSLKKHITPVNVAFFVLQGEGVVEVGEERAIACKNFSYSLNQNFRLVVTFVLAKTQKNAKIYELIRS